MAIEVRARRDAARRRRRARRAGSELDTSLLTGESRPRTVARRRRGLRGHGRARRHAAGADREGGRADARRPAPARGRAQRRRAARRSCARPTGSPGVFVAVVLALAALTWWGWTPGRSRDARSTTPIALLIVTCPCALALATPLAITVAIGRAARAGILVQGRRRARSARAGPARWCSTRPARSPRAARRSRGGRGDDAVRRAVLGARAAFRAPDRRRLRGRVAGAAPGRRRPDVASTTGGGLEGDVGGRRVVVGLAGVRARAARGDPAGFARTRTTPGAHARAGGASTGVVVARADFGDPLRPDAAATLATLRAHGWRTRLLSGDAPAVVAAVGAQLGFAAGECARRRVARGASSPRSRRSARAALAAPRARARSSWWATASTTPRRSRARPSASASRAAPRRASRRPTCSWRGRGVAPLAALVEGAARTLGVIRLGHRASRSSTTSRARRSRSPASINPLVAAILMPVSSLTVVLDRVARAARSRRRRG